MKSGQNGMRYAIGFVTIGAFILLVLLVIWFGEFQLLIREQKTYYVTFRFAPGAAPKVPVRRAGIRIGEVSEVEFSEKFGLVIATVLIDANYQLRDGDEPVLKRTLLGDTYLDIETRADMRGKANRAEVDPGATLEGRSPIDLAAATEQAADIVPNSNQTLVELRKAAEEWNEVGDRANRLLDANEDRLTTILQRTEDSVARLNTTLESINNILTPKSQENARVALQNMRDASERLTPLIDSTQQTLKRLDETSVNLQTASKPLAEHSDSTLRNLDEASRNLNVVMADLQVVLHQFRNGDGSLQRLMRDPALYQNLDDAAALLAHSLTQFEPILKDVGVFADKLARHPGELGLQGVLTRDAGLKTVEPNTADQPQRRLPWRR